MKWPIPAGLLAELPAVLRPVAVLVVRAVLVLVVTALVDAQLLDGALGAQVAHALSASL